MRHSLIRKASAMLAVVAAMTFSAQSAGAQAKSAPGFFGVGYTDIGPALGIGGIGEASASFGGRFEHAFKNLPDMGNGILGIEASFDYYSYSVPAFSYSDIPIGVTANYHFKVSEPKWDPFIGAGLGYQIISCDYKGVIDEGCADSGIYPIIRGGVRYFFKPNMAGYADAGAGYGALHLGLMFKLQ